MCSRSCCFHHFDGYVVLGEECLSAREDCGIRRKRQPSTAGLCSGDVLDRGAEDRHIQIESACEERDGGPLSLFAGEGEVDDRGARHLGDIAEWEQVSCQTAARRADEIDQGTL